MQVNNSKPPSRIVVAPVDGVSDVSEDSEIASHSTVENQNQDPESPSLEETSPSKSKLQRPKSKASSVVTAATTAF
jgi:hypothetical protein